MKAAVAERGQRTDAVPEMSPTARMAKLHADHSAVLLRFLMGYARGETQAAEDMLQETMVRAWRHIGTMPPQFANTRRWLFTVARRIAIDTARMRKTHPVEVRMADAVHMLPAEDTTEEAFAGESIAAAFRALKPEQRVVLTELHLQGRSVADIAARLGVPEGTVKSRAFYGMRSLRDTLDAAA